MNLTNSLQKMFITLKFCIWFGNIYGKNVQFKCEDF